MIAPCRSLAVICTPLRFEPRKSTSCRLGAAQVGLGQVAAAENCSRQASLLEGGAGEPAALKTDGFERRRDEQRAFQIAVFEEDVFQLGVEQLDAGQAAAADFHPAQAGKFPISGRKVARFAVRIREAKFGQARAGEAGAPEEGLLDERAAEPAQKVSASEGESAVFAVILQALERPGRQTLGKLRGAWVVFDCPFKYLYFLDHVGQALSDVSA